MLVARTSCRVLPRLCLPSPCSPALLLGGFWLRVKLRQTRAPQHLSLYLLGHAPARITESEKYSKPQAQASWWTLSITGPSFTSKINNNNSVEWMRGVLTGLTDKMQDTPLNVDSRGTRNKLFSPSMSRVVFNWASWLFSCEHWLLNGDNLSRKTTRWLLIAPPQISTLLEICSFYPLLSHSRGINKFFGNIPFQDRSNRKKAIPAYRSDLQLKKERKRCKTKRHVAKSRVPCIFTEFQGLWSTWKRPRPVLVILSSVPKAQWESGRFGGHRLSATAALRLLLFSKCCLGWHPGLRQVPFNVLRNNKQSPLTYQTVPSPQP